MVLLGVTRLRTDLPDWALVHELGCAGSLQTSPVFGSSWPTPRSPRPGASAGSWTPQASLTDAVLVGAGLSWLARPYPGGIELSADEACVARLTSKYEAWLPQPM
jgi:hypothetical protein